MKYDKNGNPVIDISFDKLTQKQKKTDTMSKKSRGWHAAALMFSIKNCFDTGLHYGR